MNRHQASENNSNKKGMSNYFCFESKLFNIIPHYNHIDYNSKSHTEHNSFCSHQ